MTNLRFDIIGNYLVNKDGEIAECYWGLDRDRLEKMGLLTVKRFKDKTKSSRLNDSLGKYIMEPFVEEVYDEFYTLRSRSHKMTNSGANADCEYKEGLYEQFDAYGNKLFEVECYDDAAHGAYKCFYLNGQVREKGTFVGSWGHLVGGAYVDGIVTNYSPDGKKVSEVNLKEVTQVGFDGPVILDYSTHNDTPELCERKDEKGNIRDRLELIQGKNKKMVKRTLYYDNGAKKAEAMYVDDYGRYVGSTWFNNVSSATLSSLTVWDEKGKVIRNGVIVDGKFVSKKSTLRDRIESGSNKGKTIKKAEKVRSFTKKSKEIN